LTEGDEEYDAELEKVAQRLLAPRDHAVFEFKAKLRKRGFENQRIETLIALYQKRGWLDDQRFADRQAELLARDLWGRNQIRKKLQKRGVSACLISAAIAKLDVDWMGNAKIRAHKKCEMESSKGRERAFRHLIQRGFQNEIVRKIIFLNRNLLEKSVLFTKEK